MPRPAPRKLTERDPVVLPSASLLQLGGADVKKLKKTLEKRFGASEDDVDLLIPKKSELSLAKVASPSRVHIVIADGHPIVYDVSGKGDFHLTVFALWRVPTLLGPPIALVGAPVSRYILQGADLMLPGAVVPRNASFPAGRVFAVAVPGNPMPIAIGEAEMSSDDVAAARSGGGKNGGKGRFLKILTSHRDALWDVAASQPSRPTLAPNAGFGKKVVSAVDARGRPVEESEGEEDEEEDEGEEEEIAEGGMMSDGEEEEDVEGDGAPPAAGRSEAAAAAAAAGVAAMTVSEDASSLDMDALIDRALLQALKHSVKDHALPLLGSALWAQHVVPCRLAGAGRTLDVKASTHKKLSKLLKVKSKLGWLTVKEDKHTKEMAVTSVNRAHDDIMNHAKHETASDAADGVAAAAEAEASATPDEYKGAAAAAATRDDASGSKPAKLTLSKVLKPGSSTAIRAVFAAVNESSEGGGDDSYSYSYPYEGLYTAERAKEVVDAYVALRGLDRGGDGGAVAPCPPGHVVLDPTLCDALFKGVLKKGDVYPTSMSASDVVAAWTNRFHPQISVRRGGKEATRKGELAPVRIESGTRGPKKVTKVTGFEAYLIDAVELSQTLSAKLATSCAVSDLEGQNNKGKSEVTLGGNKVTEACEVMTSWYGVPGKLIEKRDKLKGKR
jgi:translation initiation factor 2D